jgi:hypothetical protein
VSKSHDKQGDLYDEDDDFRNLIIVRRAEARGDDGCRHSLTSTVGS